MAKDTKQNDQSPNVSQIISEMEKGLEGVTDGPYKVSPLNLNAIIAIHDGPDHTGREHQDGRHQHTVARTMYSDDLSTRESDVNARHIARCDPQSIRAILDSHEALEGLVKEMMSLIDAGAIESPDFLPDGTIPLVKGYELWRTHAEVILSSFDARENE